MLQQTQVATATAHFHRFLARFPSLPDLAAASQDEVLALWSGLGYYSRAKNLHACAQAVVKVHGGRFPMSAQALEQLPGIGPSTAAAIASFCFGQRVSIFDGNVQRVVARLTGFSGDLAQAAERRELHRLAATGLPDGASAMPTHTQALMDLGATVCLPRKPLCGVCPFQLDCQARLANAPLSFPVQTKKLTRKGIRITWLCLWQEGKLWMTRRPDKGIWASLWTPPQCDAQAFRDWHQAQPLGGNLVHQGVFKHVLSHRDLFIEAIHAPWREEFSEWAGESGRWAGAQDLLDMGIPSAVLQCTGFDRQAAAR